MKKKLVIAIVCSVVGTLALGGLGAGYFLFLHRYKGRKVINNWSASDTFDINKIASLTKEKGKDFTIVNFADIQMCDLEDWHSHDVVHKELTHLVDTLKPDLITLTGDQTWSNENRLSLKSLISWLNGYKVPFAPVFGNHDHGNDFDSAVAGLTYCCDLYEDAKYSLFDRGPTNIGSLGNYAINILEEGKIINTIYMMDYGYNDEITAGQLEWFKWTAEGIKENNGGVYSNGLVFMHKPIKEHIYAYNHEDKEDLDITPIFEAAKDRGVTNFVCGHYHEWNFTESFRGVNMTMATKTGEIFSFYEDEDEYINGATSFTINDEGITIKHNYVDRNAFRING